MIIVLIFSRSIFYFVFQRIIQSFYYTLRRSMNILQQFLYLFLAECMMTLFKLNFKTAYAFSKTQNQTILNFREF